MGFPRASRAVEEVQKIQIRKLFGGGFWRGMQNANTGIHKYIVECFAPPARARTSCPSLAVLRSIINGGDGSPEMQKLV